MKRFLKHLDKTLMSGATVLLGAALSFAYFVIEDPNKQISFKFFVLTWIICYFVCILIYCAFAIKNNEPFPLPRVLSIRNNSEHIILIVEKNDLFALQSFVSVYFDEEYEELVAIGYVETHTTKGYMQIKIISDTGKMKFVDSKNIRNALILKPSVGLDIMYGIMNGG